MDDKSFNKSLLLSFGFYVLITLLFTSLKLSGVISWSWLWVTSPLWLPLFATVGMGIVVLIIGLIIYMIIQIVNIGKR